MLTGRCWRDSGFSDPREDFEAVATVRSRSRVPAKNYGREARTMVRFRAVLALDKAGFTTAEVATALGVTPDRVRQVRATLAATKRELEASREEDD